MRDTVQATVSAYDAESRSGQVLLDDGTTLRFAAAALEGTGLRLLRRGQRVRLEVEERDGDGAVTVTRVQIHTLP